MTPDDIDEVAVERACQGDRTVRLNAAEHHAAWQQLERRGHSSRQIARILGVTYRTVIRWRTGETRPVARRSDAATRQPRPLSCPECPGEFAGHLGRHRRRQHRTEAA